MAMGYMSLSFVFLGHVGQQVNAGVCQNGTNRASPSWSVYELLGWPSYMWRQRLDLVGNRVCTREFLGRSSRKRGPPPEKKRPTARNKRPSKKWKAMVDQGMTRGINYGTKTDQEETRKDTAGPERTNFALNPTSTSSMACTPLEALLDSLMTSTCQLWPLRQLTWPLSSWTMPPWNRPTTPCSTGTITDTETLLYRHPLSFMILNSTPNWL